MFPKMRPLVILLFLLTSCVTIYNKSLLSVERLNQKNKRSLRLDGYYYYYDSRSVKENCMTPMFLYSNGYMNEIFTYCGDSLNNNPNEVFEAKNLYNSNLFYPKDKKYGIWGWGIWWTENDSIYIEQYCSRGPNYDINYRKGLILNDSTFIITSDYSEFQLPKLRDKKKEYQFKKLISKPDSINYLQLNIAKFGKKNGR